MNGTELTSAKTYGRRDTGREQLSTVSRWWQSVVEYLGNGNGESQ